MGSSNTNTAVAIRFYMLSALALALLTFMAYIPALNNGFVNWDDPKYVYENPNIRSINLSWLLTAVVSANWHPLTMLSLALDYAVWELNPFGYHLTNVILHSANSILVFVLVARLISRRFLSPTIATHPSSLIPALITSLLFGIHPLHVESVAWVSERKDLLCAFFYLLSIIWYIDYALRKVLRSYFLCLFFFILALMSKPMAVSLPIVLLIIDYYTWNQLKSDINIKTLVYEKIPLLLIGLIALLATILTQSSGEALRTLEASPLTERIFDGVRAIAFYLLKLFFPFSLAPFYPKTTTPIILSAGFIIPLLATFGATIFIFMLQKNRFIKTVWLYYTVTLLPIIGIVKVGGHSMADRYTYLPGIGPLLMVGLSLSILIHRFKEKRLLVVIPVVILALFSIKTIKQAGIWRDSITLWTHEINLLPSVYTAYNNRGNAHMEQGRYLHAIEDYNKAIEKALEIGRGNKIAPVYNNRGNAYFSLKNFDEAIRDYDEAIKINTGFTIAYTNRAKLLDEMKNLKKDTAHFTNLSGIN